MINKKKYFHLLNSKQFDELINYLESIHYENKDNADYYYAYGMAYRTMGRFNKSIDCYKKALNVIDLDSRVLESGSLYRICFDEFSGKQITSYHFDSIDKNKPINFLCVIKNSLGIVYQLNGEFNKSIKMLEEAIEHDKFFISNYNSLALTHKKMELYEEAGSIYRKGIDKLFGKICKSITNRPIGKSSSPVEHSTDERFWRKTSIEVFIELVQFNGIDEILFPDGSFTSQYYQKSNDSGVVFIDEEINDKKVRRMLPSYLDYMYMTLKSDLTYSLLLCNLGAVTIEIGDTNRAREIFEESLDFIPVGIDYKYPSFYLNYLSNKQNN